MSEQTTFSPAMERFFEAVEKSPRDWRLESGMILRGEPAVSPLTHVAWRNNVSQTGLTEAEVTSIIGAQCAMKKADPTLRARLLECCGLSEVGG